MVKAFVIPYKFVAVDHDLVVHTLQQPTAKTNLAM